MKTEQRRFGETIRNIAMATALGVGTLAAGSACSAENPQVEKAQVSATNILQETQDAIIDGKPVNVLPGVLVVDEAVQIRRSPARLDTINSAFITGNEASSKGEKFALTRPIIVENQERVLDTDPTYWAVTWNREWGFYSVGINQETAEHMTYYTTTQQAQFCGNKLEGLETTPVVINETVGSDPNYSSNGLGIDAGGYLKPIAQASVGTKATEDLIMGLEAQGYAPTNFCQTT